MFALKAVTDIVFNSAAVIVIEVDPVTLPTDALIVAAPLDMPCTTPKEDTVAALLELLQLTPEGMTAVLPSE